MEQRIEEVKIEPATDAEWVDDLKEEVAGLNDTDKLLLFASYVAAFNIVVFEGREPTKLSRRDVAKGVRKLIDFLDDEALASICS